MCLSNQQDQETEHCQQPGILLWVSSLASCPRKTTVLTSSTQIGFVCFLTLCAWNHIFINSFESGFFCSVLCMSDMSKWHAVICFWSIPNALDVPVQGMDFFEESGQVVLQNALRSGLAWSFPPDWAAWALFARIQQGWGCVLPLASMRKLEYLCVLLLVVLRCIASWDSCWQSSWAQRYLPFCDDTFHFIINKLSLGGYFEIMQISWWPTN